MRALFAAFLVSCATTDGAPLPDTFVAGTQCADDLACGSGRHCDGGTCARDCTDARQCGVGNTCSLCGRCIAEGASDDGCISPTERACTDNNDCQRSLGKSWSCDDKRCARACSTSDQCRDLGRGFGCVDKVCARVCSREDQCWIHGFGWSCGDKGGCNYDASRAGDSVWGFLVSSAVRTQGIPLLGRVDTASIQHLLVRVRGSTVDQEFCLNEFKNFVDDDGPILELFKITLPDANLNALRPISSMVKLPELVAGATFTIERLDLRGAQLDDPATDPLPTAKDLTHAWDQDLDGFPGLTAKVSGAISGDMYQAQRWRSTFFATVVDRDHFHGLAKGPVEQTILGASTERLVNDSFSIEHPVPDRSYFRAVRMANTASCRDVERLAREIGSWLAYEPHFDPNKKP